MQVKEPTRAEEPAKSHAEGAAQAVPGASSQAQSQPQSQPVPLSTSSNQPPAQASSSEQAHTPAQQHPPPDLPLATSSRAGGRHADGGATRSTIVGIVGIAVGESSCSLLRVPGIIWDGAQALSQGEAGASAPAASKEAGSLACWKAPAASTSDSAAAASAPVAACAADGEDTEEEADEDSTPLFGGNGVMAKVSGTESISGRKRCHDTMIAEDSGNS